MSASGPWAPKANNPSDAALRTAVLQVLMARVRDADRIARHEAQAAMATGDRLNPSIGDTRLAAVTKTKPRVTASVTDPVRFAAWCAEHHPTEVQTTTVVRDGWVNAVLGASRTAGEPCAPDGTLDVPGIRVSVGDPGLTVRLTDEAQDAVERLWRAGQISLDGNVIELPEGGTE